MTPLTRTLSPPEGMVDQRPLGDLSLTARKFTGLHLGRSALALLALRPW
jgi:hypothetical protein